MQGANVAGDNAYCCEEDWSDSNSSSYSDSESSIPEWESCINSSGELLFIECDPVVSYSSSRLESESNDFSIKNELRHSTRTKFLKILRRRDSKRKSKRSMKNQDLVSNQDTTKVKFQDNEEGEIREVVLKINQERIKLSNKEGLVEHLLGITVSTLSDGNRVMVAGFISDSEAAKQKGIKIGDWLKSIDDFEITFSNLNDVLQQFTTKTEVTLKLQRVAGVDVTKNPPINELSNQSNFVHQLININSEDDISVCQMLCSHPIGILYINTENLSESGPEFEGIVYGFPQPYEQNWLCICRGFCITLNHLLQEVTHSSVHVTSILCNNKLAHIGYKRFDSKLLLLMLPNSCASIKEMLLIRDELIRMLVFMFQSIERCFETVDNKHQLDHFFGRFFVKTLVGDWHKMSQIDVLSNFNFLSDSCTPKFESVLPVVSCLPLPDEARLQVDDALTELEASDYREWNEDPLDCRRLFTIIGSALYHSGHLLSSHFVHGDLIDIHMFCKQQGLFHLSQTEPVRSLVLWREVYPISCNCGLQSDITFIPEGRRYLLIVGSGKFVPNIIRILLFLLLC